MQWKEEFFFEHDKKENNLTITPKWKTWISSNVKNMMHSLEKIHELILNYNLKF
jgi:hypothetical protein